MDHALGVASIYAAIGYTCNASLLCRANFSHFHQIAPHLALLASQLIKFVRAAPNGSSRYGCKPLPNFGHRSNLAPCNGQRRNNSRRRSFRYPYAIPGIDHETRNGFIHCGQIWHSRRTFNASLRQRAHFTSCDHASDLGCWTHRELDHVAHQVCAEITGVVHGEYLHARLIRQEL